MSKLSLTMEKSAIGKLDGTFLKEVLATLPHPHKVEGMSNEYFGNMQVSNNF